MVLLLVCATLAFDEGVGLQHPKAELQRAKAEFTAALDKAGGKVKSSVASALKTLQRPGKGKLEDRLKAKAELAAQGAAFSADGTLPSSPLVKKAAKDYLKTAGDARDRCRKVFDRMSLDAEKAGDLATAQSIGRERDAFLAKFLKLSADPLAPGAGGWWFQLVSRRDKALVPAGESDKEGAVIVQKAVAAADQAQHWRLVPGGRAAGQVALVNRRSGMAIDIAGGNRNAGSGLIQWRLNGAGTNQAWEPDQVGGYFRLRSSFSGHYLCISQDGEHDGAGAIQWSVNDELGQQWSFVAIESIK